MTQPPSRRSPAVPLVAVAVSLALALVACGPDATPSPAPATPSPAPATPSPAPATPSPAPATGPPPTPATTGSPGPTTPTPEFDPAGLSIALEPVVDGFDRPLDVEHAGDGSDRLFVAEQAGRIVVVRDGRRIDRPFLDIRNRISSGGERGLLGLAFHPRYPADPRIFVNYTDRNGDTVVASFRTSQDPDAADPGSETVILRIDQPFGNHNGGAVAFGPDGLLYVSTGDGGSAGDPRDFGQRLDTLLGKILRIDIDRQDDGRPYGIPPDNPVADGRAGMPEIWLSGLRNPWRISFDRGTGDLWIADVGQNRYEEINVHRAGEPAGTNYGWARMEGSHCYPPGSDCNPDAFTLPVTEYDHDHGCSVTGGVVYRGAAFPRLVGAYLFSDYCSGNVWAIPSSRDHVPEPPVLERNGHRISAFGEDETGEVYAVDIAAGVLLRVVAR